MPLARTSSERSRLLSSPSTVTFRASGRRRPGTSALSSWRSHTGQLGPYAQDVRRRFALPSETNVQRALTSLVRDELVGRAQEVYRITEPFLAEWLLREQDAQDDVLASLGKRR